MTHGAGVLYTERTGHDANVSWPMKKNINTKKLTL